MQLSFTNLPPANLIKSFFIYANSSYLTYDKAACFTLIKEPEEINKLNFKLTVHANNYIGSSYFTENGERNVSNYTPDNINLDYVEKIHYNISLFYKFLVEVCYNNLNNVKQLLLIYDSDYSEIMLSFLAAYYLLKGEEPEEAVALSASSNPSVGFDYATICFLDMTLDCSQKLIEAVETYTVMDVVVTKSGLITEREY